MDDYMDAGRTAMLAIRGPRIIAEGEQKDLWLEDSLLAPRYHPAPLKEMARLRFREMTDADRKAYADVVDQHALIACCGSQTWIIEGDMLRIIEVQRGRMQADQQFFALEPWSNSLMAG